jgi:hypothetical protein
VGQGCHWLATLSSWVHPATWGQKQSFTDKIQPLCQGVADTIPGSARLGAHTRSAIVAWCSLKDHIMLVVLWVRVPCGFEECHRLVLDTTDLVPMCHACAATAAGNTAALAAGQEQLPYAAVRGATSSMTPPAQAAKMAAPRDHA